MDFLDPSILKNTDKTLETRKLLFKSQMTHLKAAFSTKGINVAPYYEDLRFFSKLKTEYQDTILHYLQIQVDLLEERIHSNHNFLEFSRSLCMSFLGRAGFSYPQGLEENLLEIDYIAVYDLQQRMSFATPNHFYWISYNLEDVYCRPWFELYRRNKLIDQVLRDRATNLIMNQEEKIVMNRDIPMHTISEIASPKMNSVTCESKLYSPLWRNGRAAGFIASNTGQLTASRVLPF